MWRKKYETVKDFYLSYVLIIGGVGYGIYYIGTNIASDKIMNVITTELENSGQLNEIKKMVIMTLN